MRALLVLLLCIAFAAVAFADAEPTKEAAAEAAADAVGGASADDDAGDDGSLGDELQGDDDEDYGDDYPEDEAGDEEDAKDWELPEGVEITAENFEEELKKGPIFIEHYAPWCPHCQDMKDTWAQFASKAKAENLGFRVGKINCDVHSAPCMRSHVEGYPTINLFKDGKVYAIEKREPAEIAELFAKGELGEGKDVLDKVPDEPEEPADDGPPVDDKDVLVLSDANFDEKIGGGGTWLVKYYAPWCPHCKSLAPKWAKLATEHKGTLNVAKIDCEQDSSAEVCERFAIEGYPTVLLFKDGRYLTHDHTSDFAQWATDAKSDEGREIPAKGTKPPQPEDEIDEELKGLFNADDENPDESDVHVLDASNFDEHLSADNRQKGVFVEFYAPWCGHCKALKPKWAALAKKAKADGLFSVAKVDCDESKNEPVCSRFRVEGFPTVLYVKDEHVFEHDGVTGFFKFAAAAKAGEGSRAFPAPGQTIEALPDSEPQEGDEDDEDIDLPEDEDMGDDADDAADAAPDAAGDAAAADVKEEL